jgi:hypothetical protein
MRIISSISKFLERKTKQWTSDVCKHKDTYILDMTPLCECEEAFEGMPIEKIRNSMAEKHLCKECGRIFVIYLYSPPPYTHLR